MNPHPYKRGRYPTLTAVVTALLSEWCFNESAPLRARKGPARPPALHLRRLRHASFNESAPLRARKGERPGGTPPGSRVSMNPHPYERGRAPRAPGGRAACRCGFNESAPLRARKVGRSRSRARIKGRVSMNPHPYERGRGDARRGHGWRFGHDVSMNPHPYERGRSRPPARACRAWFQ